VNIVIDIEDNEEVKQDPDTEDIENKESAEETEKPEEQETAPEEKPEEDGKSEEEKPDSQDEAPKSKSDKEEKKDEKSGKSSGKKKKEDPKDKEIAELKDRVMRQMAEFDNYRKRTDKEKKQNYDIGASDFIVKILPVLDNFERGLDAISEEERKGSFAQGIEMIYKQLVKVLEDSGVTVIDAVGKPFDPMLHNAVMQKQSDEYESGTIIQEFQKGYKYKDRVIRHSVVVVAE
jgi:molecular chaperone GrpE